jgi:MinD superfamily P-loop ATPase
MAAQIDLDKCGRPVVTEFLCEDCNECGCVCPDHAITVPLEKVTF